MPIVLAYPGLPVEVGQSNPHRGAEGSSFWTLGRQHRPLGGIFGHHHSATTTTAIPLTGCGSAFPSCRHRSLVCRSQASYRSSNCTSEQPAPSGAVPLAVAPTSPSDSGDSSKL